MCGLIEHIEREIRAREAEKLLITLPPQEGMTTKPRTADVEETTKEG